MGSVVQTNIEHLTLFQISVLSYSKWREGGEGPFQKNNITLMSVL